MNCKICGKESNRIFDGMVLKKYKINYFYCFNCGFLQTEDPYWIDEAYVNSINISDTGYIQRNITLSKKLTILLSLFFDKNGKFLDYAGGYGMFVRLMRDIGFDFYWDDKYTLNLFARGFEFNINHKYEAITTIECFEHFEDPLKEIDKMFTLSNTIIFTTELLPTPIPKPNEWWYYSLHHGQHISFYSDKTLRFIANRYNVKYYNFKDLKVFTKKKLSLFVPLCLKISKLGLDKLFRLFLKSKTYEDSIRLSL